MIMLWLSGLASLMAAAGCLYLIAATVLLGRFARRPLPRAAATPGVTILKPLHGEEPGLFENLASFWSQDYGGPVQMICGVHDATDPAAAVVERLRAARPDAAIDLVADPALHGQNRKVSNLVNMAPRMAHELIALSDADIRVGPQYLSGVVAALTQAGVAGVTCAYYGIAASGLPSRLVALGINGHFLPSVVVGVASGRATPCFGSTIALRSRTLAEIGGFAAFVDLLADDYALGAALRERGKVAIPPLLVAHVCGEASWRAMWRHELRWSRTVRGIDPAGHVGSIVTHPLPWALVALAVAPGPLVLAAALLVLLALACRIALVWRVGQVGGCPQPYWLVPPRDLLSFAVFLASFLGRNVSWKDRRFLVGADGHMRPQERAIEP